MYMNRKVPWYGNCWFAKMFNGFGQERQ